MHRLDDGQEGHVKADHLVFSMVGNPCNLVWVQARVDGVQHTARTTDTKVQLEVAVAVPRDGGHTVAETQFHAIQRMSHLA